jgi:hypothetical protein
MFVSAASSNGTSYIINVKHLLKERAEKIADDELPPGFIPKKRISEKEEKEEEEEIK